MATIMRRMPLLLLAALGAFVCVGPAAAAPRGEVGARIVNGSDAPAGAWPSIAYLGFIRSSLPRGIAVDSLGNVYTANSGANRVTKLNAGGVETRSTVTGSAPYGIAVDAAGTVYTANYGSDTVTRITSGGVVSELGATGAQPAGIAVDAAGTVYTANYGDDTVTKITSGGVVSELGATGAQPVGIAVDSLGNVYTANSGDDTVTRITSGGVASTLAATGTRPAGIAVDSLRNVYTANFGSDTVTKITSGGSASLFAVTGSAPYGIAVDAAGTVYTANYGDDTVTRITSGGVVSELGATDSGPSAIALDAAGDVYTANTPASSVSRITAGGTTTPTWARLHDITAHCTGSVIAPRVILTAAHCTVGEGGVPAVGGFARPGVIDSSDTGTERQWDLPALLPHPDYDPTTLQNDVALAVLDADTAAPAMPLIAPWQDGLVVGGATATVAGWGKTVDGGADARFLQEATVPLIADANCPSRLAPFSSFFNPLSMLCAGDVPPRSGVCQGDSGGPLALTIAGTRAMIGDTSWLAGPCGSAPDVYGRISAFRSWILDGATPASDLVRSHLQAQDAAARDLVLTSTGPNVTLTWGVTPANWTTTGFRVAINGATETVTGPTTARTAAVPAGGIVTATVEPQVTLGTATAASIRAKPTPTRAPVVSATTPAVPRVGTWLRVTAATDDPWGGAVTYQWLLNGAEIPGATAAGYRPVAEQAGKRLGLRVRATNAVGTGTATVDAGRVRQAPQVDAGAVAVTGAARVGGRLRVRASVVGGFPRPRAGYRWFRDGRRVPGATGAVYRVRPADAGAVITGRVTWTNAVGSVTRALTPVTIARTSQPAIVTG